jgi:hypothetical protein
MNEVALRLTSWRDAAFVAQPAAAEILGYSLGHVRRLISVGALNTVRLARGGPLLVTVPSLLDFIDSAEPVSGASVARLRRPATKRPNLQLVVNNPR